MYFYLGINIRYSFIFFYKTTFTQYIYEDSLLYDGLWSPLAQNKMNALTFLKCHL